jgi:hypothetical protein
MIFGTLMVLMITMVVCCTYKNAEDVYPAPVVDNVTCDTTNISYSNYIAPLLSDNCYRCHSQGNSYLGSGYVLDTWFNVIAQANSGNLVTDISITDIGSVHHMPNGLPSLSQCDINKVKAWVSQGAKNN